MPNATGEAPETTTTTTSDLGGGAPASLREYDGAADESARNARAAEADALLARLVDAEATADGVEEDGPLVQARPQAAHDAPRDDKGRFAPARAEHPLARSDEDHGGEEQSGRQGTSAYEKALETLRREQFLTGDLEKLRSAFSEEEVVSLAKRIGKVQASTTAEIQARARQIAALEARLAESGGTAIGDEDVQELDPEYGYDDSRGALVVDKAKALAEKLGLDGDDTVVDALVDLVRSSLPAPPEPDFTGTATASLVESMILAQQRQELGRSLPSLADDDDAWEGVLGRVESLLRTGDYGADYASAFQDAAALEFGESWYEARRSESRTRSGQRINGSLEVQSVSNREPSRALTQEEKGDRALNLLLARDDGELDSPVAEAEIQRLFGARL